VIRSTFITGFPGETEADFEQLMDFIDAAELDRVGCFTYSAVEGASANALPDQVPEDVKEERRARLMERQADISADRLEARIGQTLTVLIDEISEEGAIGRSYADAPEIDGVVIIEEAAGLVPGEFATVKIIDSGEHDLWGEAV
jgi:SSU ribosomal protein S12P methylthiotransferase (EC 2.-.-.-)